MTLELKFILSILWTLNCLCINESFKYSWSLLFSKSLKQLLGSQTKARRPGPAVRAQQAMGRRRQRTLSVSQQVTSFYCVLIHIVSPHIEQEITILVKGKRQQNVKYCVNCEVVLM